MVCVTNGQMTAPSENASGEQVETFAPSTGIPDGSPITDPERNAYSSRATAPIQIHPSEVTLTGRNVVTKSK